MSPFCHSNFCPFAFLAEWQHPVAIPPIPHSYSQPTSERQWGWKDSIMAHTNISSLYQYFCKNVEIADIDFSRHKSAQTIQIPRKKSQLSQIFFAETCGRKNRKCCSRPSWSGWPWLWPQRPPLRPMTPRPSASFAKTWKARWPTSSCHP